jgi:hypothetical protein
LLAAGTADLLAGEPFGNPPFLPAIRAGEDDHEDALQALGSNGVDAVASAQERRMGVLSPDEGGSQGESTLLYLSENGQRATGWRC